MPIARIRTFDPEAISFLAAKLAACGFQLQFAAPGESELEEADLEITVTRMDSATALEQARIQAEEMNVDVTVMPGTLIASEFELPLVSEAEPDQRREPFNKPATPAHLPPWTTPYHADIPEPPEEFVGAEASEPDYSEQLEPRSTRTQEITQAAAEGLKRSAEAVGSLAHSSAVRFAEWKRRTSEAREQRRLRREQELALAVEAQKRQDEARQREEFHRQSRHDDAPSIAQPITEIPVPKLFTAAPPRSRTLRARDRRFKNAAITAALVIAAGLLGWSFAGRGGPANPVRHSFSNVQQQTPFGAALVSAPAQPSVATTGAGTISRPQSRPSAKPTPIGSGRSSHARIRHRSVRRSASADDEEVVVRHFGAKPVAQQAKAKTKDGVKIITEE